MRTATFALFAGFAYLSAGLLGLVPAALEPAPPDMPPVRFSTLHGYLLGLRSRTRDRAASRNSAFADRSR